MFDAWPVHERAGSASPPRLGSMGRSWPWGCCCGICIGQLRQGTLCFTPLPRSIACKVAPAQRQSTLFFLEWDCNWVLQVFRPWGLAMFSGDVLETPNRFEKQAHNEHSGGGGGGKGAWERDGDEIMGLGGYNPDTANRRGYAGKGTGMPRRGVK